MHRCQTVSKRFRYAALNRDRDHSGLAWRVLTNATVDLLNVSGIGKVCNMTLFDELVRIHLTGARAQVKVSIELQPAKWMRQGTVLAEKA